jgi:hypothetical protein
LLDSPVATAYKSPFFMVTLRPSVLLLAAAFGATFLACGKGKAESPEAKEQAQTAQTLKAQGTAQLPAETRVVIGVSVPKIAASPLGRRLAGELLGRDADAEQRLVDLLARCKVDPEKDVDTITIGQDIALLVRGRIDEAALVACVKAEATAAGGTFADKPVAGRTVYAATSKDGAQKVWFTFDPDHTVVVSLSEAWLGKLLDPKAPKVESAKDTAALLARVSRDAAVWGAGFLPANVGGNLVKLTDGQVTAPAQSVAFELRLDKGLAAFLRLDMKGATDAERLAAFAKGQLDWLAVAAQRYAVGPLVSKIQIVSEQASVKFSVALDDADVKTLETALAKGATPGANQNEKKEQQR